MKHRAVKSVYNMSFIKYIWHYHTQRLGWSFFFALTAVCRFYILLKKEPRKSSLFIPFEQLLSQHAVVFIYNIVHPQKRQDGKNEIPNGKIYCQMKLFGREREREKIKEIFHVRLVKKFEMKFSRFSSSSFIPHWLICKLSFPSFCFSYISFSLSHSHWVDIEQYCMTWENLLSSLVIRMWRSFYTQIKAKE